MVQILQKLVKSVFSFQNRRESSASAKYIISFSRKFIFVDEIPILLDLAGRASLFRKLLGYHFKHILQTPCLLQVSAEVITRIP